MKKLVLATLLAGCAGESDAIDDDDAYAGLDNIEDLVAADGKGDGDSWALVGTGVAYQQVNAGPGVLIAYGGYTARLSDSGAWATELVDEKLGAEGVGHIFAVRGPADAAYAAREIANTKLRAKLATFDDGNADVYVVAHSSGSFVAHELFGQVHATNTGLLARMHYANLDGGGSGLSNAIVEGLGNASFVYARDPNLSSGLSKNAGAAMSMASTYASRGATLFEVRVPSTGCNSGAGWCLHDVVITHRPHNPTSYDLARDYTDFVNRPVTTEYLDPLIAN